MSRVPYSSATAITRQSVKLTPAGTSENFSSARGMFSGSLITRNGGVNSVTAVRTDAEISDAFGSCTLKALCPVHSSELHHLFPRLSLVRRRVLLCAREYSETPPARLPE